MAFDTLPIELNSHHAYTLHGDIEATREALFHTLEEEWNIRTKANPDVVYEYTETLAVDSVHRFSERAHRKELNSRTVLIIAFTFAGREAQNALLKLLEEPPAQTAIFLIVSDIGVLLPTVRSRTTELAGISGTTNTDANAFLRVGAAERIEQCADIISNKDKQAAAALFDSLESTIYAKYTDRLKEPEWQRGISALLQARMYLADRSPSVKMLVEHVAVTLPVAS